MFVVEKEVKILDVNKEEVISTLESLNAKLIEKSVQKIYVYDLPKISYRFLEALDCLDSPSENYRKTAFERLKGICFELDDMLLQSDEEILKKYYNLKNFSELMSQNDLEKVKQTFNTNEIKKLVNRYGNNENKWVRVRQTNDTTTITIKHIITKEKLENDFQNVHETEMVVNSLEEANAILKQLGFEYKSYQEKERISYDLDGCQVDIDSWPLLPTYIEIENKNIDLINSTINRLGLQSKEQVSCNTDELYRRLGINVNDYRELRLR